MIDPSNQPQADPPPPSEPATVAAGVRAPPMGLMTRRNLDAFQYRPSAWQDLKAWGVSCLVHTLIVIVLAFLWNPPRRGTGDLIDRPVGIAVFHETKQGNVYSLNDGKNGQNSGETSAVEPTTQQAAAGNAQNTASNDSSQTPPIDLNELTKDLIGYASESGTGTGNRGSLGDGLSGAGTAGNGTGTGGNTTSTSFMGLRGSGSNFVYILDRSASMDEFGGAPMRFAKSELMKSVASLGDRNQFQIVFYNESPGSLSAGTTGGRLLIANDINKEKASRFVKAIRPSGGTEHIPGLKLGLSFAPDVIFFLTDAAEPAVTEAQLLEIQSRAERSMTTIHTVQFNRGPAPNDGTWIRELAERNRGTYRYVDISNLE